MKRRKPLRQNRKRKRALFERGFGSVARVDFVRRFGCLVCHAPAEAAHAKSRGGGGPDDLVPLCPGHHFEQHTLGVQTFERKYSVNLARAAAVQASLWRHLKDAQA